MIDLPRAQACECGQSLPVHLTRVADEDEDFVHVCLCRRAFRIVDGQFVASGMRRKRKRKLAGHAERVYRVVDGWRGRCACGWESISVLRTQASARDAHVAHLLASSPICSECGPKQPHEMSIKSPHLCKRCSTAKTKAWAAEHPSEWERSRRKSLLKKKYGLTLEDYDDILEEQGNVCAICGDPPDDPRGFRAHIDHDHKTGRVRGILCTRCNHGLGNFKDSPEILRAAVKYLLDHADKTKGAGDVRDG